MGGGVGVHMWLHLPSHRAGQGGARREWMGSHGTLRATGGLCRSRPGLWRILPSRWIPPYIIQLPRVGGRGPGAGLQFWEHVVGWMTAFNNRWRIAEERWLPKDGGKDGSRRAVPVECALKKEGGRGCVCVGRGGGGGHDLFLEFFF